MPLRALHQRVGVDAEDGAAHAGDRALGRDLELAPADRLLHLGPQRARLEQPREAVALLALELGLGDLEHAGGREHDHAAVVELELEVAALHAERVAQLDGAAGLERLGGAALRGAGGFALERGHLSDLGQRERREQRDVRRRGAWFMAFPLQLRGA